MATTAEVLDRPSHRPLTRPNMVAVGTIIWLSSELMFFSALFAMYFTIRAVIGTGPNGQHLWPIPPVHLDVPYAATNTTILVLSSVTCQMGVFAAERGDVYRLRRWFVLTFIMGTIFVLGQANEYHDLMREFHLTLASNPYGSVFYLTTGFHGLHVIGGLFAFIFCLIRTTVGRYTPEKATTAIVVSYYWHFVDVVWIGLFATIYLIQ